MPDIEKVSAIVREWVEKADNDLENAVRVLRSGRGCPVDTVGFHAQQCVEKYVKALLVWKGIPFPKTHIVRELLALAPSDLRPTVGDDEQDRLTEYATVMRYPGDYEPLELREARRAVRIVRRVRREIRGWLPKSALRRRRK